MGTFAGMPRQTEPIIFSSDAKERHRLSRDLWNYRELFVALVLRDLRVRYKQTVIGVAWAVIQPVTLMLVITVFFGYLGRFPSDGIPYPIFAYCALLPWQLFARALNEGGMSIVSNQALVRKIYFPRIILPAAVIASSLIDFAIAFIVLLALMAWYGMTITLSVLLVPVLVVVVIAASIGVSLLFAALYVRFRDIRHVLPLLTQVWFFASPIVYPSSLIPDAFRTIYGLNPMVGVIEGFRWALLEEARPPDWSMLAISISVVLVLAIGGMLYFRRAEKTFADRL